MPIPIMEVGLSAQLVVLLLLAILHNHGSFILLEICCRAEFATYYVPQYVVQAGLSNN
jgi:hypothetical protein